MKISARIACSPTEARRALGAPDLLPLYQVAAETLERWLVHRFAPPERAASRSASADRGPGRDRPRRIRAAGGGPIGRG